MKVLDLLSEKRIEVWCAVSLVRDCVLDFARVIKIIELYTATSDLNWVGHFLPRKQLNSFCFDVLIHVIAMKFSELVYVRKLGYFEGQLVNK